MYKVGDGTGVIYCCHSLPQSSKPFNPIASTGDMIKVTGFPKPHSHGGLVIKIENNLGKIERCLPTDASQHWETVQDLHSSHYGAPEPFNPCESAIKMFPNDAIGAYGILHPDDVNTADLTTAFFAQYMKDFMENCYSTAPRNFEGMGYSLSYLRRVPVLLYLARKVVEAEEARLDWKPQDQIGTRIRKLFYYVGHKLVEEKSVILWDGLARHSYDVDTSKMGAFDMRPFLLDDEDSLDPDENEPAFLPLRPRFLAFHMELAIKFIGDNEAKMRTKGYSMGGANKWNILSLFRWESGTGFQPPAHHFYGDDRRRPLLTMGIGFSPLTTFFSNWNPVGSQEISHASL